jgi:hypothetical protein
MLVERQSGITVPDLLRLRIRQPASRSPSPAVKSADRGRKKFELDPRFECRPRAGSGER